MQCERHSDEQILMICSSCEGELLCIKCAIQGNHKNHDVKDINKLGQNVKTRLQNLVGKDDHDNSELREQLRQYSKTLKDNEDISDTLCELIDKRGEFLKGKIDQISQTLKAKCRQYKRENEQGFKNYQENIQTCISECTCALDSGNPVEQIKTLRRTQGILKQQPFQTFQTNAISFNEGIVHDNELENIFGIVSILKSEDNASDACPDANTEATETTFAEEESGSDFYRRNSSIIPTTVCTSFQHSNVAGVSLICPDVKESDRCWVKCQQEREIKLVSEFGKTKMEITFDLRIRGMTMTSDGILYVASHQAKTIWKIVNDGHNLKKTKAFGTGNLMPYHICADEEDNLLVTLLDEDNFELKKKSRRILARYNSEGKMIGYIEHDDRGQRLFVVPDKVHMNRNNGDVIVINRTSRDCRHLIVLSSSLKLKFRHLSEGTVVPKETLYERGKPGDDVQKFLASDICTDTNGNVLMAVPHRNCVYLLNSFFVYENTLPKSQDSPWSIAIQQNGKLWVGYKSGKVSVMTY